jgi:DNA topoisomerase-2
MVDGLKTSLRKILFCAFKRRLTSELKVAQFSGYVSEHSAYHHGEASLNGAIVNMAQNFVGSNNIPLLKPLGQFGTRLQGGDDSASERYIFTMLNDLTRALFPETDDAILRYLDDDGTPVEPEYYVPILPFALVNGISGIGTGFSCNIPAYNPVDLITYIKNKLLGYEAEPNPVFVPYYQGFRGRVERVADTESKFLIRGVYTKIGEDKIRITELPVGTWTMPYVTFLEGLMDASAVDKNGKKIAPSIKDFVSVCTEMDVDIVVQFPKGDLAKFESQSAGGVNGVEKLLKLTTTVSTTNMHLFDADGKLKKYQSVEEIIDAFFEIRMALYAKRKAFLVDDMRASLVRLSNKAKYILETLDDVVDLRRKTSEQVNALLESRGYDRVNGEYKYLVKLPMDSVTKEQVEKALKEKAETEMALQQLLDTTEAQMWMVELDNVQTLLKTMSTVDVIKPSVPTGGKKTTTKTATGKATKGK